MTTRHTVTVGALALELPERSDETVVFRIGSANAELEPQQGRRVLECLAHWRWSELPDAVTGELGRAAVKRIAKVEQAERSRR